MKAYFYQGQDSWLPAQLSSEKSDTAVELIETSEELQSVMREVEASGVSNVGFYLRPHLGAELLQESWLQPAEVSFLKVCDSVFSNAGNWVPRSLFKVALKDLIHQAAPDLSLRHAGYVAGCGAPAKIAAAVMIEQGFRRLGVICSEEGAGEDLVKTLEKLYFGVQFQLIPLDQITLAPSDGSLLVNTLSEAECPQIFEDLSYLNFLTGKSLVISCRADEAERVLEKESGYLGSAFVGGATFSEKVFSEFLRELGRHSSQSS